MSSATTIDVCPRCRGAIYGSAAPSGGSVEIVSLASRLLYISCGHCGLSYFHSSVDDPVRPAVRCYRKVLV